ncbi:MAG: hypothetical protein KF688_16950 [Pirellulales bacterium]|nr:hypothetical protein [Pirellulales bacterium]
MNTSELIQAKFQAWARRQDMPLQAKDKRGAKNYTLSVEANLFGGQLDDDVRNAFNAGAGGELRGEICSLQALHSSAAMAVNVFQYWLCHQEQSLLAKILSIPSTGIREISFEKQLPVCSDPKAQGFKKPPHVDVCVEYTRGGRVGIECKLHEPFGRENQSLLSDRYLQLSDAWKEVPRWRDLASKLSKSNLEFKRLGPAQLVKHVLGLMFDQRAQDVRLLYFYYDAPGFDNSEHLIEIRRFSDIIVDDPIRCQPISVQEFIAKAFRVLDEKRSNYLRYLSDRYL